MCYRNLKAGQKRTPRWQCGDREEVPPSQQVCALYGNVEGRIESSMSVKN
jgi:hypothetical protein